MRYHSNTFASPTGLRSVAILALCLLVLSTGCARTKPPTREQALDYGQFTLRQLPPDIDLDALKEKRIVIDPGHGGTWGGAVGPNNLREADVNLGVGLYLWGMLKQAGADAYITRISDSVVYGRDDLDLKKDLQARAEFANEYDPDLFVSLHHNADVMPGQKKNTLETYFKMSDPGPSLDAAKAIHRQLAISLGQTDNMISPGNFHVLRETTAPAVLGEPSYISHAGNAFRLGLAPMQRKEAQAYFLGIAEYFSKGVPRIENVQPVGIIHNEACPLFTADVVADFDVPIDANSIEMLVDGVPVPARFDREAAQIEYLPSQRFSNGKHVVSLSLRNMNGNAARPVTQEVEITMPPAYVLLSANFTEVQPGSVTPIRMCAHVFDADLMPVADGTQVEFAASSGNLAPRLAATLNGEAVTYLVPGNGGSARRISVSAMAGDFKHSVNIVVSKDVQNIFVMNIFDEKTGMSVENALVMADNTPLGHSDRGGYFATASKDTADAGGQMTIVRQGYEPGMLTLTESTSPQIVKLKPIADRILFGKKIALDPKFGGEEKGVIGPTGVRESDLNLDVAKYLALFLQSSGAHVVLTREQDETVSALRRVEIAEKFGAEWFISIGHGMPPPEDERVEDEAVPEQLRVLHYPVSEDGKKLASSMATLLQERGIGPSVSIEPAVNFVLTHTSGPAVVVVGPSPATPEQEEILTHPSAARGEAYTLYCAILDNFGLKADATGEILIRVMDAEGNAVPGAILTLDGAFNLETDAQGMFTFSRLTPGEHRLEVYANGLRAWEGSVAVQAAQVISAEISLSGLAVVSLPETSPHHRDTENTEKHLQQEDKEQKDK